MITANGRARVLSQSILAEQLLVETEDHRRVLIHVSEILSVIRKDTDRGQAKSDRGNRQTPPPENPPE